MHRCYAEGGGDRPSCSGGGNVVAVLVVRVTAVLKDPFLGWRSYCEGGFKSSWTGGSAPPVHELLKRPSYYKHLYDVIKRTCPLSAGKSDVFLLPSVLSLWMVLLQLFRGGKHRKP